MARALKVYRTPIGFHDAYVAASSQAAALKAWGTDRNLFAGGAAELVTDPALTADPLAHPGKVIKKLRGSADEQMAAASAPGARQRTRGDRAPARQAEPRPSRAPLDKAEEALAHVQAEQDEAMAKLTRQIDALDQERRALARRHLAVREKLERARAAADAAYTKAVEQWRRASSGA